MSVAFVDQGEMVPGRGTTTSVVSASAPSSSRAPEQFQESCPFGGVEGSAEPGEVQVSGLERAECGHSFPGPGEEAFEPELRECVRSFEGEDHVWGRARKKNRIIVHGGSRTARCSFRHATICGISRNLANLGVAPEMADEEHPEGTGGGGGQEPGRKRKTRQDEPPPSDPGQVEAASAAAARAPAPQAAAHAGTSAPGGSSAEYVPPPPAGASADSSGERGISGALALWGPLIIIGFLVLVLNTEDAPQGRPAGVAPVALPVEAPAATAELPSDLPQTQSPTVQVPAESVAEVVEPSSQLPAEVPEEESAAAGAPSAAVSHAAVVEDSIVESDTTRSESTESTGSQPVEPVLAADEAPQIAAAVEDEPAEESRDDVGAAEGLDLDAVLEVARTVIGQAGVDAAAQAVAEAQAPPPASELPAAVSSASQHAAPAPAQDAAAGAWGASRSDYQATGYPVWSSNPGASAGGAAAPAQGEAMWGPGATEPGSAAAGADWPPPPATATGAAPFHAAPAMMPGTGYWPRPPVLVPCAPPFYWCIALPSPLYHPAPHAAY